MCNAGFYKHDKPVIIPLSWLAYGHKTMKENCTSPAWGLFLESPGNFSGPESYLLCAMFALKTQILLALKAEQ